VALRWTKILHDEDLLMDDRLKGQAAAFPFRLRAVADSGGYCCPAALESEKLISIFLVFWGTARSVADWFPVSGNLP